MPKPGEPGGAGPSEEPSRRAVEGGAGDQFSAARLAREAAQVEQSEPRPEASGTLQSTHGFIGFSDA